MVVLPLRREHSAGRFDSTKFLSAAAADFVGARGVNA
jgi:hypothetical protein